VIRVWERRYRAVTPERTEGGSRLYSDLDVQRLQLLQRLTTQGHAISALATLPTDRLLQLAGPERTAEPAKLGAWAEQFLNAARALDTSGMDSVLSRAGGKMSARELVLGLVAPVTTEIGAQWQRGELTIAQEHAATAALRDLLARLRRNYDTDRDGPIALAATLIGERHELGLLMAVLLAAMAGWNTVYLGTEVPAEQLVGAVRTAGARLLLLSLVSQNEFETRGVLRELRSSLPDGVEIVVGGRAAVGASGVRLVRSLEEFDKELEELRRDLKI
jgi:MerR family transcriptional regulator, light-induced transcriptional regulator